jgi:hypothetical protein
MEGFDMNDWEITEELIDDDTGRQYKYLSYKHNEGEKQYGAWYWSPEEIYFEVYENREGGLDFVEGGMTWSEALEYVIENEE